MGRSAQLWQPPDLNLGQWIGNGAGLFANAGSGFERGFSPVANDELLAQVALSWAGIPYDGSSTRLRLFSEPFQTAPGAGDNVIWEVDYALIPADGTVDAETIVTGTLSDTIDISARTANRLYQDALSSIPGVIGAEILNLTLRRKSSGGGSDTFSDFIDIHAIALERV